MSTFRQTTGGAIRFDAPSTGHADATRDDTEDAYKRNAARCAAASKATNRDALLAGTTTPTGTAAPVEDANADPIENARQRMIARNLAAGR